MTRECILLIVLHHYIISIHLLIFISFYKADVKGLQGLLTPSLSFFFFLSLFPASNITPSPALDLGISIGFCTGT